MAKRKNYPDAFIAVSAQVRKGKYVKGPSVGLWRGEEGPMFRGSTKDEYLADLIRFMKKHEDDEYGVSFAIFKNNFDKKKGKRRDEDEDEDDDEDEGRSSRRRKGDDEEEEGEGDEDEPKSKRKKHSRDEDEDKKPRGKKKGKKDDWDFDDD